MRVYFTNLGCKLNQAEVESLTRQFLRAGHVVVASLEAADLHVVNSCTVTHSAARDSRKVARRGARQDRGIRTVLTGCYVDSDPETAAALAGVDLVVPNIEKDQLLARVEEAFPAARNVAPATDADMPYMPLDLTHARAMVKIEDGCNMRCSFCIIPFTRGPQKSRPPGEIVKEISTLVADGYNEVVVTGVQISSYRWEDLRLFDLVQRILRKTSVPRIRLTSIAPWAFDPRILELFDSGRICRHFHLSLQSGCSETLSRMRRPYSAFEFAQLVGQIRDAVPGVAITTDVIVGFPGETDGEFEDSLQFCREIGFARLHVFPYSPRPGTEAADHAEPVPHAVQRRRMKRMLNLASESLEAFRQARIGETAEVLWERQRDGLWRGTTDHYVSVLSVRDADLSRQLEQIQLGPATDGGLLAQPVRNRLGAS